MLGINWIKSGIEESRKKSRWMKTVVHQYRDFSQINLSPVIPTGKNSSKSARNPERASTHSRKVGGNLVPQTKQNEASSNVLSGLS